MKRKTRKEKAIEQAVQPPAEELPTPEQTPPAPVPEQVPEQEPEQELAQEPAPETIPEPAPEPTPEAEPIPEPAVEKPPVPEPIETAAPAVVADEELPPPPADVAESAKSFPPLKTRRPGPMASLRRAGAIFGKDASTIAKHGLISSVILLVFLMIVFYISSYTMFMLVTTDFGNGGEDGGGDGGPNLGNDGSLVASAGSDQTVTAGTLVTLSSASTVHRASIVYVEWDINQHNSSSDSFRLYGSQTSFRFTDVGNYTVSATIVDSDWNADEANFSVKVNPSGSDTTPPVAVVNSTGFDNITCGNTVMFNASDSSDDVVNWTWTFIFQDVIKEKRWGEVVNYRFAYAGNYRATLVVRDASGFTDREEGNFNVMPTSMGGGGVNAQIGDLPQSVRIGDTVNLDASQSFIGSGNANFEWYVSINNTRMHLTGQRTSFVASTFGMYEITLVVKDQSGNAATSESSVLSLSKGMDAPSMISWKSTPLGQDIPMNVLTFAYGASLLASVIYLGGLFSKGFAHEIQKGTAKTLFFAPLSVTNMVFAKLLYPLILGPLFMFPLLMISLLPLQQDPMQVLEIGIVSYVITALVLVSAAYGSCMIYAATKRMSVKPTVVARSFMYLSLVGTLTIFAGLAYLMDNWFVTDTWNNMYVELGPSIAMFSPFHQGGLLLQSLLFGAPLSLDWIVFVIPAVLIVGGILASRKLYGDIFSRE